MPPSGHQATPGQAWHLGLGAEVDLTSVTLPEPPGPVHEGVETCPGAQGQECRGEVQSSRLCPASHLLGDLRSVPSPL